MHLAGLVPPALHTGKPLASEYKEENIDLVLAGCCNLARHIQNCAYYGVPVVVAINRFVTDTDSELEAIKTASMAAGMASVLRVASVSRLGVHLVNYIIVAACVRHVPWV